MAGVAPRLKEWPGHSELLRKRVARARKRGYALNDGQIMSAMWAVGVPVRDGAGQVVAALSIAAITERMQGARLDKLVGLLPTRRKHRAQIPDRQRRVSPAPAHRPRGPAQPARGGRRARGGDR